MKFIISSGELQRALQNISGILSYKKRELEKEKGYKSDDLYSNFLSKYMGSNNLDISYNQCSAISYKRPNCRFIERYFSFINQDRINHLEYEIKKIKKLLRFLNTSKIFKIIRDIRLSIKLVKTNISYRAEEDIVGLIILKTNFLLIQQYFINEKHRIKK